MIGRGDPVQRRQRLRGWRWSSYRSYGSYSGLVKAERWLSQERVLGEMGGPLKGRRLRYRRFVEEGLVQEIENPLEAARWQTALGREHFVQRLKDHLDRRGEQQYREVPALRQLRRRPEAQSILDCVARVYRCSKKELLTRGGRSNEARAVAMVMIWDRCGMGLGEMGALFGGAGYTAVAQMIGRTREKDRHGALKFKLAKLLRKCVK